MICRGWDQSSMAGANVQWPDDLYLNITRLREAPTTQSVTVFSWRQAAPFFIASLVAFFITDFFVNEGKVGRRWAIVFAGCFSLASVVGAAFIKGWKAFMACRLLLGVGMGAKASIVPIYLTEIAPDQIRGMLAMSWQLFDTFGIFIANCANLLVFRLGPS
ncbi:hypothetical protein P280DRAFT_319327 [Massarina eburnea CBS 473.64]|uniref:Major facilitator superfamily (MFS) profile domain-containing protein n=1 Tax=Massarina eburnea CBS 473.64 TaxID=1395130 RepID=A0A6A6RFN3_9PLEO|nr:hypothetical protein P280DRAFT_319327 [Massarina eburnea CBS 473.64]